MLLATALPLLHPAEARAELYEFVIDAAASNPGRAIGIGDPGRSSAARLPTNDVVVSLPLAALAVQRGASPSFDPPQPGYLEVVAPPPGITPSTPTARHYIALSGGPPDLACISGAVTCSMPIPHLSVPLVGLPVDVWGRFERSGAGETWIPNANPGARFTALPPIGLQSEFPGLFSMRPLIPEPPIALLFAIAIGAATTTRLRWRSLREAARSACPLRREG